MCQKVLCWLSVSCRKSRDASGRLVPYQTICFGTSQELSGWGGQRITSEYPVTRDKSQMAHLNSAAKEVTSPCSRLYVHSDAGPVSQIQVHERAFCGRNLVAEKAVLQHQSVFYLRRQAPSAAISLVLATNSLAELPSEEFIGCWQRSRGSR